MSNKPSYNELKDFIKRLDMVDCEEIHTDSCKNCHLFASGLCKEAEELSERVSGMEVLE